MTKNTLCAVYCIKYVVAYLMRGDMPGTDRKELNALKSRVSLTALARSRGIELKPAGKELRGLCPLHAEDTPSFSITEEKRLWHCFGCNRGGDVFNLVMELDGVTFPEAARIVEAHANGTNGKGPDDKKRFRPEMTDTALLKCVMEHYQERLFANERALAYLAKRGIEKPETLRQFGAGCGDMTLNGILPSNRTNDGKELRERLVGLGVLRDRDRRERFAGYLTFPFSDDEGLIHQVYGRRLDETERNRDNRPVHMYLPRPRAGLINHCFTAEEIILCESVLDAMTFHQQGFHNVTSSYGCNGFTLELLHAIFSGGVKRVRIAYDADERGRAAALETAVKLGRHGVGSYHVHFPDGMDANEFALQETYAHEALETLLNNAELLDPGQNGTPDRKSENHGSGGLELYRTAEDGRTVRMTREEYEAALPSSAVR